MDEILVAGMVLAFMVTGFCIWALFQDDGE